jgi:hypothetical protein
VHPLVFIHLELVDAYKVKYYGSCGRYLPPRVNLTRIEDSRKKEKTLMSWLITLEVLSAQEDNLY